MTEIDRLIDVSAWTGNWPFIRLRYANMDILKDKLKSMNVAEAFLAPIEAILEQDPIRANLELLQTIGNDFFSPVLVIDLSFENWQDSMELALDDSRAKMVKLVPNYHMYRMYEKDMEKLVGLAKSKGIVISVQMSVEDVRSQHPAIAVSDVDVNDVIKTLSCFPGQTFILNNVKLHDVKQLFESLSNIYIDISYLECQDILENLHKRYSLDRFLFSSHCPFFYPEGNLFKLKYSSLEKREIDKVAYANAEKIFRI